tara:strand:- start:36 stop:1178 length:1143 start_codon:yes stop_codon:yes gene_type:complete
MEIPEIYKGLSPTDLTYKEFKPTYAQVKKEILEEFPDVRINDPSINKKIYERIGFPAWEGKAWLMNGGVRRNIDTRRASALVSGKTRYQTTRNNLSKVQKEYFDEAGALWDELVGNPKGSFTMGGKTFKNRLHYQNFEVKRQVDLDKKYKDLNKARGMTHGHAVPLADARARESRVQSFSESASGNFSSKDKLPTDYDARLKKANIPLGDDVAKVAVGTSETITDPLPSAKIEKILKTDSEKALALTKYNNTKVIAKNGKKGVNGISNGLTVLKNTKGIAKNGAKLAGKAIPYVGLGIAGGIVTTDVKAAVNNPSAKNFAKVGLSSFDAGLEVVDAFTGGLSTPVTLALQLGTEAARHYLDNGAAKISTKDRRRYRNGKV